MLYEYCERIKGFLEREVCAGMRLKAWHPDEVERFELVNPQVTIGWRPAELAGCALEGRIPCIVIGFGGAIEDDGMSRILPVELGVIVCEGGSVARNGALVPDNSGYHDLLNLLDRIDYAVRNAREVGAGLVLASPKIEREPENEQYYDFWLGRVSFTLLATAGPRAADRELLDEDI